MSRYQAINDSDSDESSQTFRPPNTNYELSRLISTQPGGGIDRNDGLDPLLPGKHKKAKYCDVKTIAFFGVGVVTLLYCVAELGIGGWIKSLALMADGFHNLSDVVSLIIANWANQATKKPTTFDMSFGWARSEILGGLVNAVFLLALCLYTSLEAIFEFIEPTPIDASWWYMGVAAAGVAVNTLGTLIFCATGNAHGHSHGGHGHSHGGHGHSHGGEEKKEKKHGHSHSDKKEKHGHSHSDKKEKHGHGHGDKKEKHGHSHSEKKEKHGHGHGDKKEKHGHSHSEKKEKHGHSHSEKKEKHGHSHSEKKEKHGHGHGHGDKKNKDEHGHDHGEKKERRDENVYAVFIHYLGDMFSSLLVLIGGIVIHFFGPEQIVCGVHCNYLNVGGHTWTNYIDPFVSMLIVALILYTTLPVVSRCLWILLQKAPDDMNVAIVRQEILMVDGVVSIHDLHIWQLVDGMVFCSCHISVQDGISWDYINTSIRKVLHRHGVHSSSIQPEFVQPGTIAGDFCEQNCVEDCDEDWCCKTPADTHRESSLLGVSYEDPLRSPPRSGSTPSRLSSTPTRSGSTPSRSAPVHDSDSSDDDHSGHGHSHR